MGLVGLGGEMSSLGGVGGGRGVAGGAVSRSVGGDGVGEAGGRPAARENGLINDLSIIILCIQ